MFGEVIIAVGNGFLIFLRRTAQGPEMAISLVPKGTPSQLPDESEAFLTIKVSGAVNGIRAYSRNWRQLRQLSGAGTQNSEAQANVKLEITPWEIHFTRGSHQSAIRTKDV